MDFSDQLCFRKLLTVLHRFLKTLFIMKSTKTIFAKFYKVHKNP